MTEASEIRDTVRATVGDHLGVDLGGRSEGVDLGELGADSLDLVEIALELEARFDVTLSDEAVDHARTLGDLVRCVERAIS